MSQLLLLGLFSVKGNKVGYGYMGSEGLGAQASSLCKNSNSVMSSPTSIPSVCRNGSWKADATEWWPLQGIDWRVHGGILGTKIPSGTLHELETRARLSVRPNIVLIDDSILRIILNVSVCACMFSCQSHTMLPTNQVDHYLWIRQSPTESWLHNASHRSCLHCWNILRNAVPLHFAELLSGKSCPKIICFPSSNVCSHGGMKKRF